MSPLLAGLAGLAAGSSHVVTGPDHIAAVLPLSVGQGRRAVHVGLAWGAGHAAGVVVLAALGQVLRSWIDVEAWSAGAESMVGVLLIALGAWTLWRTRAVVVHTHDHDHDHDDHEHVHVHVADPTVGTDDHPEAPHTHPHSAAGFGLLHGAAGTGHLLGVLPTLALPTPVHAAAYVAGYLVAAVAVMGVVGAVAGRGLTDPGRVSWALRASGVAAIVVGAVWIAAPG